MVANGPNNFIMQRTALNNIDCLIYHSEEQDYNLEKIAFKKLKKQYTWWFQPNLINPKALNKSIFLILLYFFNRLFFYMWLFSNLNQQGT